MKQVEIRLKEEIDTLSHRIKEVEETTDLTVLKSDKLLWEIERERTVAQLDAWQRGTPSFEGVDSWIRLTRSLGLQPYCFAENVDEIGQYVEYRKILQRMGFPEKCCERTITQLAMCEIGELPKPNVILNTGQGCDADRFQRRSLANLFKIPVFYLDVPLNEENKPDLANLNYIADQLGDFIEWAGKKVPGVEYNKDKHIEMLEIDAVGEKCTREIWQLIKHIPCPIAPLDSHRKRMIYCFPSRYPNMRKAVEYLRICRDELRERVATNQSPYPEERLRLLWAGQPPAKQVLNIGKLLFERKIASPFSAGGLLARTIGLRREPIGEMSEYGVKLSPLQEEARNFDTHFWGGPGKRWVHYTLEIARDLGAHGIIHFLLIGCTPMRGLGTVVAERAEKELGIPVLNVEGRYLDPDFMSQEQYEEILSAFIDKCFDWAGKPRQ